MHRTWGDLSKSASCRVRVWDEEPVADKPDQTRRAAARRGLQRPCVATAILDRLLRNSHVLTIRRDSHPLKK